MRAASCHSAPCPCPRPLLAVRWTTARWQSIQASESVGSGEKGGWKEKRRRRLGKKGGGDPVVFHGGEGSSSQLSPSLYRQAHFPGTQATFLHLAQAETIASNWDSQQRHGPSGILSFSFSFSSFLPPSFSFSLSPSSFLPPFIGVYLQSLQ